ncbi:Outer membrane protein OprM precursor [compost metagenome]
MFPLRTLALVVSAGLLAGCVVGPDYHRPDAPLAERYQAQSAVQQRSASRPASFAVWWDGFGDPLLSKLVTDALAQNLDLAQATARMTQSRAGLGVATAALLPSGNISGQAARAYQSVETPLGQVLSATPYYNRYGNSYETNLNASWEIDVFGGLRWRLFDFGRINAQIDQAKGQEQEALAAYRLSVLRATEDVENALSALINSETQTAMLIRGETALASARRSSFIAYQQGTSNLIDVLHNDENLLQASDAKAQAQTESAHAAVAAFRALGGGWQPTETATRAP